MGIDARTELLYEDLKNKLDFVVARQAESQAEHSYRMAVASYKFNVIAVIFFPIVTLMAIFSSNLQHPFADWEAEHRPWPFVAVLLAGLALGTLLATYFKQTVQRPQRDIQSKSSNSPTNRSKYESAVSTGAGWSCRRRRPSAGRAATSSSRL